MSLKPDQVLWENLKDDLDDASRGNGVVGYSLLDLSTGKRLGFLDNVVFPTASTIKIAVLLGLASKVHDGQLSWEERIKIEGPKVFGSGILSHLKFPLDMALWDVASLMISLSDNDATNICIDLAEMDYVNDLLVSLGLTETKLRRKMMDEEAVKRGDENVSTPFELTTLLAILYRKEKLPAQVCEDVLTLLKLPKDGPFTKALPSNVERANKPGGLAHVSVDSGIIYLPRRPFVLTVMGSYLSDNPEETTARVIRVAYKYMSLLDKCTEYGRS